MAKKVRHYAKKRPIMSSKEEGKIHIVQLGSYSRPEVKEYYNDDFVAYRGQRLFYLPDRQVQRKPNKQRCNQWHI